jgi:ribosomal-protein-serine acetyltransferase
VFVTFSTPAEELHGDAFLLRRWRLSDVGTLYRVITDTIEHLEPWTLWAMGGYSEDDAAQFCDTTSENWESGEAFDYAVFTEDGELAGAVGLMARIGTGGLEIGYWLHHARTGRGLMTRSVALVIEEAFRIGADRIEIVHDAANSASEAIPRRLGFTELSRSRRRGTLTPAEIGTDVVWRLLRPAQARA